MFKINKIDLALWRENLSGAFFSRELMNSARALRSKKESMHNDALLLKLE
jgi:hypothetical protein